MRCVSESSLCASVSPIYLTLISMNLPGYHPTRQTYFLVIPGSHEADLRPHSAPASVRFEASPGSKRPGGKGGERPSVAYRSGPHRTFSSAMSKVATKSNITLKGSVEIVTEFFGALPAPPGHTSARPVPAFVRSAENSPPLRSPQVTASTQSFTNVASTHLRPSAA